MYLILYDLVGDFGVRLDCGENKSMVPRMVERDGNGYFFFANAEAGPHDRDIPTVIAATEGFVRLWRFNNQMIYGWCPSKFTQP